MENMMAQRFSREEFTADLLAYTAYLKSRPASSSRPRWASLATASAADTPGSWPWPART